MCLELVFSDKLEGGLLKYKTEHFSEKICSCRGFFVMDVFVCVAYYSDSFLLCDIRVNIRDIN